MPVGNQVAHRTMDSAGLVYFKVENDVVVVVRSKKIQLLLFCFSFKEFQVFPGQCFVVCAAGRSGRSSRSR